MFTLTCKDMQICLNVSPATPKGWLGDCARSHEGGRFSYRLSDVLPRIRQRRPRGLSASEARSLVDVDCVKRAYGDDMLYAGEETIIRAWASLMNNAY